MNSYNGASSSSDQVSGWDLFNTFYGNSSTSNNNDSQNSYNDYSTMQHQQHQQAAAAAAQQQRANQYYAAMFNNSRTPGYSLGMPNMNYYDHGGYDLNNVEHSSADQLRYANDPHNTHQGWNDHIDEINAGSANHGGGIDELAGHSQQSAMMEQQPMPHYDYGGYDYMAAQQQQQQQQQQAVSNGWGMNGMSRGNETSLRELDYCDLLLTGLENAAAAQAQPHHNSANQQLLQNQLLWNSMGGNASMGGLSAASKQPAMSNLDYFMNSMQHSQQQQPYALSTATASSSTHKKSKQPSSTASHYSHLKPSHEISSTISSSIQQQPHQPTSNILSTYLPHSNSSQPEKSIDPLLETLSLSIPSVSLTSLTGNEVIMHIRSKTDDVITRFLPCVDFLVNCQQELRQGLAIANQRKYITTNGRSRSSVNNMTPLQFFARFVAPLPKKFERKCDFLMERDHLISAKLQLDQLVKEAQNAVPQGCEHVKNTFLGGMRENESWGLRKWLSKHGGAGSICNDLEEVLRKVKSLKREEKTTIKLAELLRPIASQAHDRLKKDVPAAYQEQSAAHPYLPFFHRLEACLKQMATYDPEDDDVILLDSDDDDDEVQEVKVESSNKKEEETTDVPKSSAVKKRILHKREREEEEEPSAVAPPYKRGKSLENISPPKVEKRNTSQQEVICLDDSSDDDEEGNDTDDPFNNSLLKLEGGLESPSQSPIPETNNTYDNNNGGKGWRCQHCTCLNAPNVLKCTMCNDEDSSAGNETDELARFLGGGFMDDSGHD
ncbi:hypothetical protein ACHAWO_013493 [Cyclotella atomus]|uniref:RanBP2-type domain-containing protein n=1 Tax=Cyclotella atomus TaxID=382360 RepID=A0ABD3QAW6_9STRA